jgi:type IV pilus assembly protein PilA
MKNKAFTLVEIMIVVVIIGLLAVMAIPAFNKVRQEAREKTILNNLRQIASAGEQYLLDKGTTQATYNQLIHDGRFAPIKVIAGETYSTLTVVQNNAGTTSNLVATAAGNDRVVYTYE